MTKIRSNSGINNICISVPANVRSNEKQSIEIAKLLRHAFPTANIKYFFHRGICKDPLTPSANVRYIDEIRKNLQMLEIPYYDIAYSKDGFKHYTNCDLHVGHRVHAHIYNLSCRNRSILLEEDARGSGVNEALGLWGIKAYERRISSNASLLTKGCNKLFYLGKTNHYATENLKACMDYLLGHDDIIFTSAFRTMQDYYACMNQHIASIEHIL